MPCIGVVVMILKMRLPSEGSTANTSGCLTGSYVATDSRFVNFKSAEVSILYHHVWPVSYKYTDLLFTYSPVHYMFIS